MLSLITRKWWSVCLVLLTTATIPVLAQPLSPAELANGTIHIVAVMAEFQQDTNRFTTGDGRFNPTYLDRDDITIDPLPHDRGYFEAHLTFAQNYFRKASAGRLTITFDILPEIITLPQEMAAYSPLGEDGAENEKLGFLARDAWAEVARRGLLNAAAPHDADRTMYIIFHAGAGRDLELTGTTLDKTPQDIPSVYLSQDALQRLLQQPNFDGFNGGNGTRIRNSAILPETQSRPGTDILGNDFVLELSINGILTANIGSFLGLPDLFNTETGESGIGRFGLMDGAGFFSYFGLFPPAPSAWERYFLGWVDPVDITPIVRNGGLASLDAFVYPAGGTVAKYPISADEYFLVENRIREYPAGQGLTLTIRESDGSISTHTIARDEDRFDPFDLSDLGELIPAGVLIDVSHLDWSLPGGLDVGADRQSGTADDRFLNGGILIWHIDEQVIRSRIGDNAVNNDPQRRGVRLVEADAAQDIGRPAGGVTQYAQGSAFDFWWSGNDFTVITLTGQRLVLYENRFGDDTRPNNRSNTGARTNFEFYDFSDGGQTMTFQARLVSVGDIIPTQLPVDRLSGSVGQSEAQFRSYPLALSIAQTQGSWYLMAPHQAGADLVRLDLMQGFQRRIPLENPHQPILTGNGFLLSSSRLGNPASSGEMRLYNEFPATQETPVSAIWTRTGVPATGLPAIDNAAQTRIHLQRTALRVNLTDGTLAPSYSEPVQFAGAPGSEGAPRGILTQSGVSLASGLETVGAPLFSISSTEANGNRLYLQSAIDAQGEISGLYFWSDERLVILRAASQNPNRISVAFETDFAGNSWPVFRDWNGDGESEIFWVNTSDNTLEGRHLTGAFAPGFPLGAPGGFQFEGAPMVLPPTETQPGLLFVLASDAFNYVLLVYRDDDLRRVSETLLLGPKREGLYPIQPVIHNGRLFAVSPAGDLRAWHLTMRSDTPSFYLYGNAQTNILQAVERSPQSASNTLLHAEETYNWPNPASDHTFIRYQTREDATVAITIIGFDGSIVQELRTYARAGVSGEIRLDTSSWGNGVYFARISARAEGKTAHKRITMVVIR